MKPKAYAKVLQSLADYQAVIGAKTESAHLQDLADVMSTAKAISVDAALSSAHLWVEPKSSNGFLKRPAKVSYILPHISALEAFLATVSTAPKRKPFKSLLAFLGEYPDMDWSTLTSQLRTAWNATDEDVVAFYVDRLNATYQDGSSFKTVFDALKKDKRVKVTLALDIASGFTGHAVKGTKTKAFDWIWKKHEYYTSGSAASRVMDGKSAA